MDAEQRQFPWVAVAIVVVLALVAWLTMGPDRGSPSSQGGGDQAATPLADDGPDGTADDGASAAPSDGAPTTDDPSAPAPSSTDESSPAQPTATPTSSEPSASPTSPTTAPTATASPRTGPANGGATDVGVTRDTVKISVVTQESGAIPREDPAGPAVRAFAAYVNQELGGVHGRRIQVVERDNRFDPGMERQILREACEEAFAVVGSTAWWTGSDSPRPSGCDLADLRGATYSSSQRSAWGDRFSVAAHGSLQPSLAPWKRWAEREPDAVARAGWVSGSGGATDHRDVVVESTTRLGYDWVQQHGGGSGLPGLAYDQWVVQLRDAGVEFVHFDGGGVELVRFAQAMERNEYEPTLLTLPGWVVETGVLEQGGAALEGAELAVDVVPWAERQANPSLRRYATWLAEVEPGMQGSTEGALAWAAASIFVDALRDLGPDPTRAELADVLREASQVTADGVLGARSSLDGEASSDCIVLLRAASERWVRGDDGEAGTFTCVE